VNGLTFIALIALAAAIAVTYRIGFVRGERAVRKPMPWPAERAPVPLPVPAPIPAPPPASTTIRQPPAAEAAVATSPRETSPPPGAPPLSQLTELAEDRHRLFVRFADALGETARYRQIVIDIERNAPPPLLDAPGAPDDLKLIVGVGPALERMLYQLGVTNYRQIARWSEHDIDEIDARLAEFPGRIRRDAWVTQARELHQSKYGERP
jgi:predicted flap endonuclease-1-like 5' DNA nuclease